MRFYIEGPCYVEVDGAILIEPCVPDSHTPPPQSAEAPTLTSQPEAFRPRGSKHRHPHQRVCRYCGVLFMGRRNQLYCQDSHKAAFYRAEREAQ